MSYDYKALLGKIVEVFGTQARFAKAMNKSERTISMKLNNKRAWTQEEMVLASEKLDFENGPADIPRYFFVPKVQS